MLSFFKELKSEFKKITWPSAKEVFRNTGIVLVVCAILSAIVAAFDLIINWLRGLLDDLFLTK